MVQRIYISGKISGLDPDTAKGYFELAEKAILQQGHIAINPFNIPPAAPNPDWHDYMAADLAVLLRCDGILMLANWRDSKGARIEHAVAEQLGIQIIYAQ